MNPLPEIPRKRLPVVLAVLAAATLLAGVLLRRPTAEARGPSEQAFLQAEIEGIRQLVERNSIDRLTQRFAAVAQSSASYLAWMPAAQRSGVVWRDDELVTGLPPRAPVQQSVQGTAGFQATATPRQWGYGTPIATYALDARRRSPRRATIDDIPLASWMLAVTMRPDGRHLFTPGTYSGAVRRRCGTTNVREVLTSIPFSREMLGGGLFTVDGDLAGIIIECNEGLFAAEVRSLEQQLRDMGSPVGRMTADAGAVFTPLAGSLAQYFGPERGVLIAAVWNGSPADQAGLIPGDVIAAANGQAVATPEELAAIMGSGQPLSLQLRRRGVARRVTFDRTKASVPPSGVFVEEPEELVRLREVVPGSRSALAGLRAGDQLVLGRAGGADTQEFLTSGITRPMYLVVQRQNLREGIFLTP